jgi:hypothetical protein
MRSVCLPPHPAVAYLFLVDMAVDLSTRQNLSGGDVLGRFSLEVAGSGFEAAEVSRGELVFPAVG